MAYRISDKMYEFVEASLSSEMVDSVERLKEDCLFDRFFEENGRSRGVVRGEFNARETVDVLIQIFAFCKTKDDVEKLKLLTKVYNRFYRWTGIVTLTDEVKLKIKEVIKDVDSQYDLSSIGEDKILTRIKVKAIVEAICETLSRYFPDERIIYE